MTKPNQPTKTACHKCRVTANVRDQGPDGEMRIRQVPAVGDGELYRHSMVANGMTAVTTVTCDMCDGSGWIPGFVPPC